jgi:hypothetical protein
MKHHVVVHTKPVVEVRGEVEVLDKTLLGKRFKAAVFEQSAETISLSEGRTVTSYHLAQVQRIHVEMDVLVIALSGGNTVSFRANDAATASRWMNLLAQWVSYLRQVSVGQVLGELQPNNGAPGRDSSLGGGGGGGGGSDVVFESRAAKAFGGVWDDELHLKLRGRVLQYHRTAEDDDVLGYVTCSSISVVTHLGLRDDGELHMLRIGFRLTSEQPWELGFETRALAEEWRRVISLAVPGGGGGGSASSLLASVGRQVGKKIFQKSKKSEQQQQPQQEGSVGAPFNVVKQNLGVPAVTTRNSSLSLGGDEDAAPKPKWKQPTLGEDRKQRAAQKTGVPSVGNSPAKKKGHEESSFLNAYDDIDVEKLHVDLEHMELNNGSAYDGDAYDTLQPPEEEAPRPGRGHVVLNDLDDDGMDIDTAVFAPPQFEGEDGDDDDGGMEIDTAVFVPEDVGEEGMEIDAAVFSDAPSWASHAEESVASQLQRVLSVYDSCSSDVSASADDMMQSEDLISLGETLQEYLELGDTEKLRRLTLIAPQQNPNDVRKAVAVAASQAGMTKVEKDSFFFFFFFKPNLFFFFLLLLFFFRLLRCFVFAMGWKSLLMIQNWLTTVCLRICLLHLLFFHLRSVRLLEPTRLHCVAHTRFFCSFVSCFVDVFCFKARKLLGSDAPTPAPHRAAAVSSSSSSFSSSSAAAPSVSGSSSPRPVSPRLPPRVKAAPRQPAAAPTPAAVALSSSPPPPLPPKPKAALKKLGGKSPPPQRRAQSEEAAKSSSPQKPHVELIMPEDDPFAEPPEEDDSDLVY